MGKLFFNFISAKVLAIFGWISFVAYIIMGMSFGNNTSEIVPLVWQYLLCCTFYVFGLLVVFIFVGVEFLFKKFHNRASLYLKSKSNLFFKTGYFLLMSPILGLLFLKFKVSLIAFVLFAAVCVFFKFLFLLMNK